MKCYFHLRYGNEVCQPGTKETSESIRNSCKSSHTIAVARILHEIVIKQAIQGQKVQILLCSYTHAFRRVRLALFVRSMTLQAAALHILVVSPHTQTHRLLHRKDHRLPFRSTKRRYGMITVPFSSFRRSCALAAAHRYRCTNQRTGFKRSTFMPFQNV